MKVYAMTNLLFIGTTISVLMLSNVRAESDLYVLDSTGKPVKLDLSANITEPDLTMKEISKYVTFSLYTRATGSVLEQLHIGNVSGLAKSHFDPKKPTKFVTHGWISTCNAEICSSIRKALLQHGDYNVIQVDWEYIANKEYLWSKNQVVNVARYVSQMLDFLQSQRLDPSNVTMIGHSLGAHLAGLSSRYAEARVDFVVGLDPAAPGYIIENQNTELTKLDAKYVEVIHTSTLLGMNKPIGHVDFFPNGALEQNGCTVDLAQACSHFRSYEYYAESINSDAFVARKCSNFLDYKLGKCNSNRAVTMGGATPNYNVTGEYYLETNASPPYAKG